jgi:hypothetical protein
MQHRAPTPVMNEHFTCVVSRKSKSKSFKTAISQLNSADNRV